MLMIILNTIPSINIYKYIELPAALKQYTSILTADCIIFERYSELSAGDSIVSK